LRRPHFVQSLSHLRATPDATWTPLSDSARPPQPTRHLALDRAAQLLDVRRPKRVLDRGRAPSTSACSSRYLIVRYATLYFASRASLAVHFLSDKFSVSFARSSATMSRTSLSSGA
jgi:hypothetical protein